MANNNWKQNKKSVSYVLATLFSTERNGNEYQFVKVGFYDEKLTLNFYKGVSGVQGKGAETFMHLDYEALLAVSAACDRLIQMRVDQFRKQTPYTNGINIDYNVTFTDNDTKSLRSVGHLVIKTQANSTGDSVVFLCYNNGTTEWSVALGSTYLPQQLSLTEQFADIDIKDSRFYAFAYLLRNLINNWPVIMMQNKMVSLMMSNFSSIKGKLGISYDASSSGGSSKNGGGYGGGRQSSGPEEDSGSGDDPF